jgi:hypothetical protein
MKPKRNHTGTPDKSSLIDRCQTPAYALDPLLPYLPPPDDQTIIWEPAAGEAYLAWALYDHGYAVAQSDVLTGQNFFHYEPPLDWSVIVTNPPYSIKYDWLARCYALGKPFALLMPVEMIAASTAQRLFKQYGIEILMPDKRINFKMPNAGWNGNGAQFPTCWYTFGLSIGSPLTFVTIHRRPDGQMTLFDAVFQVEGIE